MRCLSLAQACQARGIGASFLGKWEGSLSDRLTSINFVTFPLQNVHPDAVDVLTTLSWLRQIASESAQGASPWLVLDGYHFDSTYQESIRSAGYPVLVIDDLAHLSHYHANVLLNQNATAQQLSYTCDEDTVRLLGLSYVLLRAEFLAWRGWRRTIPDKANSLLITLGGGSPGPVIDRIIEALKQLRVPELRICWVVGPADPNFPRLMDESTRIPELEILFSVSDLASLMARSDAVLCTAGCTGWEVAYMGLPAAVLQVAENQRIVAQSLEAAGAACNLGWHEDLTVSRIVDVLKELLLSQEKRRQMSEQGYLLVDGGGVNRVLNCLSGYHAHLTMGV
jgi:UDP-2,4-diacetamido-2,4,6-trideoxy-beta-L-altropyranose hydrolase